MNTQNIAFVFPGQGVQYVGMGKDLYDNFACVRHCYQEISESVNRNIADVCFNGPQAKLNVPENTSLGIYAHSMSIAKIIEYEYKLPVYAMAGAMVGHSMGQYSALCCADAFAMADAAKMLAARSNYMAMSGGRGGMAAIVGLTENRVQAILADVAGTGYAAISNFNARDQFIISGHDDALDLVVKLATESGALVAKRLNVQVPAHCELMAAAAEKLRQRLDAVSVRQPKIKVFSNQTTQILDNPENIKHTLVLQMTHGVRWAEIMEKFPQYNIQCVYEIGPGQVLSRLINRAKVGCQAYKTDNLAGVMEMLHKLEKCLCIR